MNNTINMKITGMTCQHCVKHATEALEAVAGVDSVEVALEPGGAVVIGDADSELLIAAVKEAGYEADIV
ncbi:MAG: heavy metal-binding protein [Gammaproteobacteria bacterium]|nr:heavy metal-binding protein [Gammaproteobacteria bacterium]